MKSIVLLLAVVISFSSCTDFGKKIKVEGTKGEVYYKGDGVTEQDAKKTGDFLKDSYFSADKGATVQVTKEGDAYNIRFVYDKEAADTIKGLEDAFKMMAVKLSDQVFNNSKVNISLADQKMKDFRKFPFDEEMAKTFKNPPAETTSTDMASGSDFDHEKAGGVDFYWKGISDEESKRIADYIITNGSFGGGTAEIYMTVEEGKTILRFPVVPEARQDPAVLAQLDKVTKQIKDNVFATAPYSFYMTDEQLKTIKAWDY